jgi:hypothetical protein
MTYLALFRPRLNEPGETRYLSAFHVNVVTVLEDQPSHQRSREAQSPWLTRNSQADQHLQAVAPAQTAGRRVGAGAGATPVFVAMIRHEYLPRSLAFTRGSLPHLPLQRSSKSEGNFELQANSLRRSSHHGNSHS